MASPEATDVPDQLHRRPALAPIVASALLVFAIGLFLYGIRIFEPFEAFFLRLAQVPRNLEFIAVALVALASAGALYDHWRRLRPPHVALYLRLNRAFVYGLTLVVAGEAWLVAQDPEHIRALCYEVESQLVALGMTITLSAVAYIGWLHPLCDESDEGLEPYQAIVERQRDTYDFVLGVERPGDWKTAVARASRWFVMPEQAVWTNLLCFGGIGSGKTTSVATPLLSQAIGKFPENDALRPSAVVLALKTGELEKLYRIARELGREQEFWAITPGNALVDGSGADVIPRERFLTWNPVGGSAPADIRALLLLDGLNATQTGIKGDAGDYWRNVESEFLSATLQLLDVVDGHGVTNLHDLYLFGLDPELRNAKIKSERAAGSTAQLYFSRRFNRYAADDQNKLISGLAAKLSRVASPSLQATFCPTPGDTTKLFAGFEDVIANKPGIVVFSVPEGTYGQELARLLGVMFLRSFQTALLRRLDPTFEAAGGNTKRLVMLSVDEAWAFMNPGVGSFTAVSRQARTFSVFLSQSLDQIGEAYRETVIANFRTKVLLGVNDELTLKTFSTLFGEVKEQQTSVSTSESLNDARHGVLTATVRGKNQGLSRSTSTSERMVPRFSQTDIQHLPESRAVVHLFDGAVQRPAVAIETTPHFRLAYHLTWPLAHPSLGCRASKGSRSHHAFRVEAARRVCGRCGHVVEGRDLAELEAYERAFPHLFAADPTRAPA